MDHTMNEPSTAFVAASWMALLQGAIAFALGLSDANVPPHEKGYLFMLLIYALFSAVSLQKAMRERVENNTPVASLYCILYAVSLALCVALLAIGLFNAPLLRSEKAFYAMAFLLELFGAVTVQKNVQDMAALRGTGALNGDTQF